MLRGTMSSGRAIVREGDLIIRSMLDAADEYARVAAWRNHPHVREWWEPDEPPMTTETAEAEYQSDVVGRTATRAGVIKVAGTPVGFVQFYPWAAFESDLAAAAIAVPAGAWVLTSTSAIRGGWDAEWAHAQCGCSVITCSAKRAPPRSPSASRRTTCERDVPMRRQEWPRP